MLLIYSSSCHGKENNHFVLSIRSLLLKGALEGFRIGSFLTLKEVIEFSFYN